MALAALKLTRRSRRGNRLRLRRTASGRSVVFNLRFPGQYFDAETGLHYNYFRDYDPATGRYVESDPIGLAGGMNTYAYVGGNPLTRIDPVGLETVNLSGGYTGRVDPFNYGGESSFEIHVFDKSGNEVGVYGPKGWIDKHGLKFPPEVPAQVENSCRGVSIDRLRAAGKIPTKGRANIKGWKFLRFLGIAGVADAYRASEERACELNPAAAACSAESVRSVDP